MTKQPLAKISYDNGSCNVSGELNYATVMDLWNESLPFLARDSELRFNFVNVVAANSAALALLLEWLKYARQHGKRVVFQSLPKQLQSIALVSGVEGLINKCLSS